MLATYLAIYCVRVGCYTDRHRDGQASSVPIRCLRDRPADSLQPDHGWHARAEIVAFHSHLCDDFRFYLVSPGVFPGGAMENKLKVGAWFREVPNWCWRPMWNHAFMYVLLETSDFSLVFRLTSRYWRNQGQTWSWCPSSRICHCKLGFALATTDNTKIILNENIYILWPQ